MQDLCIVKSLGLVPYRKAWDLQRRIHSRVVEGRSPNVLLLLEHPHVYTLGRRGQDSDILADADRLEKLGAEVHHVDRGGEVTYHGPGQLVGYPIVNLRQWRGGPLKFVQALERTVISTLGEFGVNAESEDRPTGVWVGNAKIAAIGVRVSRAASKRIWPRLNAFQPTPMPKVGSVPSLPWVVGVTPPVIVALPSHR